MAKGLDTTENTTAHIPALKAAGYTFVCRYLSHSAWKNITKPEAVALSAAGLSIVSVWESAGDHAGFFTYAQGKQDGQAAFAYAHALGQPFTAPIYFAVDADLPCSPGSTVWEYFLGVRDAMKQQGQMGVSSYLCGVYGSGNVCKSLHDGGMVSYTWLAQSTGWSGSSTYAGWNIKQGPGTTIATMNCDTDMSNGNGGGWSL